MRDHRREPVKRGSRIQRKCREVSANVQTRTGRDAALVPRGLVVPPQVEKEVRIAYVENIIRSIPFNNISVL